MDTRFTLKAIIMVGLLFPFLSTAQTVGISGNGAYVPNANSILDLDDDSGTKGALLPRMSAAQRGIKGTPHPGSSTGFTASLVVGTADEGLTIFNTSTNQYNYWDGTDWQIIPNSTSGNTLDEAYDEGGPGAGRVINGTDGAVAITSTGGAIGLTTDGDIQLSANGQWIGAGAGLERFTFDQSGNKVDLDGASLSIDDGEWVGIGAGTERIVFDGTDDEIAIMGAEVGIGTEDPDAALHVRANSTTGQLIVEPLAVNAQDGMIVIRGARDNTAPSSTARLQFENYDNNALPTPTTHTLGSMEGQLTNGTTNVGDIVFRNSSDGLVASLTETMRLTKDGKVDINDLASGLNGAVVTSNSTGVLNEVNFSGLVTDVLRGDGTFGPAGVGLGDNLGNHTATTDLDMDDNAIVDIDWATSDDGAGSELDADLLDGQQGTYYLDNTDNQDLSLSSNTLSLTNDGTPVDLSGYLDNTDNQDLSLSGNTLSLTNDGTPVDLSAYLDADDLGNHTATTDLNMANNAITNIDWATSDDGAGSGLDADLLDGQEGTYYLDNTDNQDLSLSGNILSLTNDGTTVDLSGYVNTDDQTLAEVLSQGNVSGGTNIDMQDASILDANTIEANVLLDPEDATILIDDNISHTGFLNSQGANYTSTWMQFDEDQFGNSLILGGGGLTAIGAGESASQVRANVAAGTEVLHLASDNGLQVYTNMQGGWASRVDALSISNAGVVEVPNLGGSGNAVVTTNNTGVLSKTALSGNANHVYNGNGAFVDASTLTVTGDNLGNHTATTNLNMAGNDVNNAQVINSTGDHIEFMRNRTNDTSYEWVGFYSGSTRQGIILYDGAWTGANNSSDEFGITAEAGNKLTLNTDGDDIALMPDGSGNVGVNTLDPLGKLHVRGGKTYLNQQGNNPQTANYANADLVIGDNTTTRGGYTGTNGSHIFLQSSAKSSITALDESQNLGQISYENLRWTLGENIGWGNQTIRIPSLADASGAIITSNATGDLGKTSLTANANHVLNGNGAFVDASTLTVTGDNLGNHTATTTLNLQGNAVTGSAGTVLDGGGGWHRSYGSTGWYNGTHGGGIFMNDGTWIRTYGSKSFYHNTGAFRTDGTLQVGGSGATLNVPNGGDLAYKSDLLFGDYSADRVGINTNTPSTDFDVNGTVRIRGGSPNQGEVLTATNGNGDATWEKTDRGQFNSATVTAGNWYRIAMNGNGSTTTSGGRANAIFTLRDYISGGGHSTMTFRAGISYNNDGGISFTMLSHSKYSTATFTKVRIIRYGTYATQYLEVYCNRSGSVDYSINDNHNTPGWTPVDWTAGSVPAGHTVREYDTDKLFVVGAIDDEFTIDRNGDVGIGVSNPTYKLHVSGSLKTTGINETSDSRLKKDVAPIEGALSNILKMNGVTYNWRNEEFPDKGLEDGLQYGLIAQELEKIIPELVDTEDNEEAWKSIEYSHLVPVLIEAIKEQQAIIDNQKLVNAEQTREITELRSSFTAELNALKASLLDLESNLLTGDK